MSDTDNLIGTGNQIYGNTIHGTPQGGIYDTTQNTQIFGNDIHFTSRYSNDYGITIRAEHQNVYDNVIDGRGRGIDAESRYFNIASNTISVYEEANNTEYGGCELAGRDGIRIKNYDATAPSIGFTIVGNKVTVSAKYCQAQAMRFTAMPHDANGTVANNTFVSEPGRGGSDSALSFDDYEEPAIALCDNTFQGSNCVTVDWDRAAATVSAGNTWKACATAVYDHSGHAEGTQVLVAHYPGPQHVTIADVLPTTKVVCGPQSEDAVRIGGSLASTCTGGN